MGREKILDVMMMDRLDVLESNSIYIIREAYSTFNNIALLWSTGKDSSVLLHLALRAFGEVPFPVMFIDTGCPLPGVYEWRDNRVAALGLDLVVAKNPVKRCDEFEDKLQCCGTLKTEALKLCLAKYKFDALLLGIRSDEHGVRAKERVFSPRDSRFVWDYMKQPPEVWSQYNSSVIQGQHIRVHPLLDWTELDVWKYIQHESVSIPIMYFAKDGKRYRSLGCAPCCTPILSNASNLDEVIEELKATTVGERSGRAQDKEALHAMQRLRALGYM